MIFNRPDDDVETAKEEIRRSVEPCWACGSKPNLESVKDFIACSCSNEKCIMNLSKPKFRVPLGLWNYTQKREKA